MKKILIISLLALSACQDNPLPQTTSTFKDEAASSTQSTRAKVADFIFPEVNHEQVVQPTPQVVQKPTCYSTWDKPVCFEQPERQIDGSLAN